MGSPSRASLSSPRPTHSDRIRDDHDPTDGTRRLTQPVTDHAAVSLAAAVSSRLSREAPRNDLSVVRSSLVLDGSSGDSGVDCGVELLGDPLRQQLAVAVGGGLCAC